MSKSKFKVLPHLLAICSADILLALTSYPPSKAPNKIGGTINFGIFPGNESFIQTIDGLSHCFCDPLTLAIFRCFTVTQCNEGVGLHGFDGGHEGGDCHALPVAVVPNGDILVGVLS